MTDARPFPRWLLRKPAEQAAGRVFCFPCAGAGASAFNKWPRWLGTAEVCPIQLPGRENRIREEHFGTYEELARNLTEALSAYLDRPFALFGHCASSLAAFETSRRLADLDLPVSAHLVISAQAAPGDRGYDRFVGMSDEDLCAELRSLMIARGASPSKALIDLGIDVLRKDLDAATAYAARKPSRLPLDISVVSWTEDKEVSSEQFLGWEGYGRTVRFTELPGGHYEFLTPPAALLKLLAKVTIREQ